MAVEWINGWEYNNGKPCIRDYDKDSKTYSGTSGLTWWTWQKGGLWIAGDVTTRFKNTTQSDLIMDHLEIRTCACDSNGEWYWAWGGKTTGCYGHGGLYYAYIRVSNDGGKTWETSDIRYNIIPPSDYNMNSRGTSGTSTASFGNPPYKGNNAFIHHDYPITNCPAVLPGGLAVIHLGIHEFYKKSTWPSSFVANSEGFTSVTEAHNYIKKYGSIDTVTSYSQCCIKFNLDPGDMVVQLIPEDRPYVWKMVDGKWECVKPAYIMQNGQWKPLEEVFKI